MVQHSQLAYGEQSSNKELLRRLLAATVGRSAQCVLLNARLLLAYPGVGGLLW